MRRAALAGVGLAVTLFAAPAGAAPLWTRQASPNRGAASFLQGVTTTSTANAWAAGFSMNTDDEQSLSNKCRTLLEHYDGSGWTTVSTPNPNTGTDILQAIKATSPTNAWAVGASNGVSAGKTLVLHYDGVTWSQQGSPNPDAGFNSLAGVTATGASNAWAVGFTGQLSLGGLEYRTDAWACVGGNSFGGSSAALIEHYNGTRWSVQPSVTPTHGAALTGASATSPSDVWASGFIPDGVGFGAKPLVEHNDGTGWSRVTVPDPRQSATTENALYAISADSPTDVWAVGYSDLEALILHYNGSTWSARKINGGDELFGVKALSPTDVYAVGVQDLGCSCDPELLILHYNGTNWTIQDNGFVDASLGAVGATGDGNVFTVGNVFGTSGPYRTLVLHHP